MAREIRDEGHRGWTSRPRPTDRPTSHSMTRHRAERKFCGGAVAGCARLVFFSPSTRAFTRSLTACEGWPRLISLVYDLFFFLVFFLMFIRCLCSCTAGTLGMT